MKQLIDFRDLPQPDREELVKLRQLHQLNMDAVDAAIGVESAARTAKLRAMRAATETQVRLELLEEKLGLPPKVFRDPEHDRDEHETNPGAA